MRLRNAHLFWAAEYLGMSGIAAEKISEVFIMYNNGFCGNSCWWIIILILLFCGCGNNGLCGSTYNNNNSCGCGCDNNCGCC